MILGHKKQQELLEKSIKSNKLSHAYLFYGPEQVGKKTVALEFIKLLNCPTASEFGQICGKCRSCRDIEKRMHPDLSIIETETPTENSSKKEIKITQIKKLQRELSLSPYQAKIKTVIVDEAENMNSEAQNCFLKTLEEPKGETILILIVEHPETLLPTILSRVEKIKFSSLPKKEIENYLRGQKIDEKTIQDILLISDGKPGLAIDLAAHPEKITVQKQRIKDVARLSGADTAFRFQYAKTLSQNPQELKDVLDVWQRYLRNVFLLKMKGLSSTGPFANYTILKLKNILKSLQDISSLINSTNVNPRLALEMLMMEL
ncbi:MAG: DNA polymerase III subunit delta' [bacterium]